MNNLEYTLAFILEKDRILLGKKKRGFGAGRWNEFGGKIHPPESVEEALCREFEEEAGIVPINFKKIAEMSFHFKADNFTLKKVHVFMADAFSGEIIETEEMAPKWFPLTEIPFDEMWEDDIQWFPLMFEGKKFTGSFVFDRTGGSLIEHDINIVEEFK
jgi:8-oxo-dGTP diphosphatase/2-hydroxy-dATP diphosphatase